MHPKIYEGEFFEDFRGKIFSNNKFDFNEIRRSYIIENISVDFKRGWKGHKIEKRWFQCIYGEVEINVANIDQLEKKNIRPIKFTLSQNSFDILYVPPGYATMILQKTEGAKVQAFSDFKIGQSNDENLRWEI